MRDKSARYAEVVQSRRSCLDCGPSQVRPLWYCDKDEFGSQHIGPWTDWQDNLNAELMVVGREWGEKNYLGQKGRDLDRDPTNGNLLQLIHSIDEPLGFVPIGPPSQYQGPGTTLCGPHYFTNAMLCLRRGGASSRRDQDSPEQSCYDNCCSRFLRRQIELVQPLVVVTLGLTAYKATARGYGIRPAATMHKAVEQHSPQLTERKTLVPVFHPGYWG